MANLKWLAIHSPLDGCLVLDPLVLPHVGAAGKCEKILTYEHTIDENSSNMNKT